MPDTTPPSAIPRRLLIIRLKSLGDILLSAPLARAIATQRPEWSVDYLIDASYAGVTRSFGVVGREILRPSSWIGRLRLMSRLRRRYDVVIEMHGSPAAAVIGRMAARELLVGPAMKRGSRWYDRQVPAAPPDMHTVESNLHYLAALGLEKPADPRLELVCDETVVAEYRRRTGERAILLHAGARFKHKRWPAARFRLVAEALSASGWNVQQLLGPEDELAPELSDIPVWRALPADRLPSFLRAFALFLGNDSGPMHFAAAVGVPVVALFGPSDANRWRPYSSRSRCLVAPCRCGIGGQKPCRYPAEWCMEKIGVEQVLSAVTELLSTSAGK